MITLENEKLKEELNSIRFYKCSDIKIGDVLHYEFPEKYGVKQIVKSLIKIVYYSIFSFCNFMKEGTSKTLTLFSNCYSSRADHREAFDNVVELIDNKLVVTPSRKKLNLSNIKDIIVPLVWIYQMKDTSARLSERIVLSCGVLFRAYRDFDDVELYINKNGVDIRYVLVYCDVMPIDCYFIQKFNIKDIITVTLQHGMFSASLNSWAYLGSKSKYFLAESQSIIDAAKNIGYEGNMMAVGSPHNINTQVLCVPDVFRTDVLGIVMNSEMVPREDNISMIKIVEKYCKTNGKKLMLKLHPSNDRIVYEEFIDSSFVKIYGNEINAEEFGNMIDVAIVSASTVFNTMLMKWKPVLLFVRDGHDLDMFYGTEKIKFSNEKQFADKIDFINTHEYKALLEKYRSYFLCSGVYRENYKKALQKIGIM